MNSEATHCKKTQPGCDCDSWNVITYHLSTLPVMFLKVVQTGLSHLHSTLDCLSAPLTSTISTSLPVFASTHSPWWGDHSGRAPREFSCSSSALILSPMYPDISSRNAILQETGITTTHLSDESSRNQKLL